MAPRSSPFPRSYGGGRGQTAAGSVLAHEDPDGSPRIIQRQTLRRRGSYTFTYQRRGVVRRIRRAAAFRKVRHFFEHLAAHRQAASLFLSGG